MRPWGEAGPGGTLGGVRHIHQTGLRGCTGHGRRGAGAHDEGPDDQTGWDPATPRTTTVSTFLVRFSSVSGPSRPSPQVSEFPDPGSGREKPTLRAVLGTFVVGTLYSGRPEAQ